MYILSRGLECETKRLSCCRSGNNSVFVSEETQGSETKVLGEYEG